MATQSAGATVVQTLPPDGLKALLALDDVPLLVPQPGPLTLEIVDGAKLALVLHASAEGPGKATWRVGLQHLRLDDVAVAAPGTPTATAPDAVAAGRRPDGCTACPSGSSVIFGANPGAMQLLVALAGLTVACWRRLRARGVVR